ncbi:PAP/fibrillin family protein [uncultured Prochlorococcus sp.]|uniref:PAP/fibrillin family protein n=1 Tax=uncultured Prochlorococcus sp. TaxID=159733 RepID=UPI00258A0742|nr:PAP/fibrillin family protein [uncultured Prochlorococcus sp.]
MYSEDDLLNLLLKSPNSESISTVVEQLEIGHNFSFSKDRNDLHGVWELRWSSSNSPFLKYSPFIDNLQFLDPCNLNGLNLLKPRGIRSIIGTGILISLYYINEKKIGVKFTHAGVIGPKFGRKNIKAMKEINNEQLGWLEITYISSNLRICRGDKGTLFVLRKINSPTLFNNFKEFIKIY